MTPNFLSRAVVGLRARPSTALAVLLGLAWAGREVAMAREHAKAVESRTITLDEVEMKPASYQGKPVGQVGIYTEGETPASEKFVVGRFVLPPGLSPHPPHTHLEEEVLIVESGRGEIVCGGKTTKVGPGSVMVSTPNVPHGIENTGSDPIVFTFIKWTGKK